MPTIDIRMPEEKSEGTEAYLGRWLKKPGDTVEEYQPLIEINTDKVTIEIAAPASGVLTELSKAEGDAVLPGDLLGRMSVGGDSNSPQEPAEGKITLAPSSSAVRSTRADAEDSYSPAVRRMLKQNDLDPQIVPKLGRGGRLTSEDIEAFLESHKSKSNGLSNEVVEQTQSSIGRKVPHTPMRKSIANHMARSIQTAPHVTSLFEADLSRVLSDRARRKAFDDGTVPSVTAYIIQAALNAIKLVPEVNSKWHDDHLEVFDWVNFGVGTALDTGGLVVPVIRDAHLLDLLSLSQSLRDLTGKARSGKLTQSDMQAGTFTLSNHGVSGSLLAAPIILPHGQAAILGTGKMQKRVIVCETEDRELLRVRPMMYVTLTVDHRVLDGQQANAFLTAFVAALEKPSEASA